MNALATKLAPSLLIAALAAGCTDLAPGDEADQPELGTSDAALLAGGTTWTARIQHVGDVLGGGNHRWGNPTGSSITTHNSIDSVMLGPATPILVERLRVEAIGTPLTERLVKLVRVVNGSGVIVASCTIPPLGSSCSATVSAEVPADSRLAIGIVGGVAGETEVKYLASWTFHES